MSSVSYTSALVVILLQQRRPNVQLQYLRNGSITLSEDTRYWQGSMLKCNMLKCNMDKQDRGLAALLWCLAYMLHTHYRLTFRKISWLCILVQWRHIQHFSNKEGGGKQCSVPFVVWSTKQKVPLPLDYFCNHLKYLARCKASLGFLMLWISLCTPLQHTSSQNRSVVTFCDYHFITTVSLSE